MVQSGDVSDRLPTFSATRREPHSSARAKRITIRAITRSFPITEHVRFKLRGEFYDAFNHPQWSGLNTTITSPAFGSVTGAMDPRVIQFSGRISF